MLDLQALRDALPKLAPRDAEFALSLLTQARKRNLSDKQLHWVAELTARASRPAPPEPAKISDLSGVMDLFHKAGQKLKHPAVIISSPETGTVRLSVAGTRAKVPGSINVTDTGKYPDAQWYGRITQDGTYQPSRGANAEAVTSLLRRFAADPATVAAEHGKMTGGCCFCGKQLTDNRSIAVGYGKVCSAKWGVEYGKVNC